MNRAQRSLPLPRIDIARCNGCGVCEGQCPTHAVAVIDGRAVIVDPAACSFCEVCESYCPTGAIGRPFTVRFATSQPSINPTHSQRKKT
jgi:MinD superfamily P-loop ATPase